MSKFDEMRAAMKEAGAQIRAADLVADEMATMLIGRLRKVKSSYVLNKLKRELKNYNMNTRSWK